MPDRQTFSPLEHPQAKSILNDPTAIRTLVQSPQARELIQMLQRQGDLNEAAKQAKNGDTAALQSMLNRVGQSPEGGRVLDSLKKQMPK